MIYTVTFNPSLDYIVGTEGFQLGNTNRTVSELMLPGGKGINVSTVLKNLGIESTALGFTAGFTGEEIRRRVGELGFRSEFIDVGNGFSRINVKMKEFDGTEINGQGPVIGEEAVGRLLERLDSLEEGDTLVLAGSIPSSMPDSIYSDILARLEGRGIVFVVDATKDLLLNVLKYRPFLIKPNHHELGEIFGVELENREDVVPYAERLQEQGAQNVLVSMGGKGAVLLDAEGNVHMLPVPKGTLVNAVGSGDSMVAGFLAGWTEKKDYEHAFKMGISAGSASAFSELLATEEEIRRLYETL
ncbi:MAG: 1-phosphofructokinase [Mediterraneibacter sp.]|nr:1-phosphofructokinase [Candidatus Mediterraneibacter caccogallinarum]